MDGRVLSFGAAFHEQALAEPLQQPRQARKDKKTYGTDDDFHSDATLQLEACQYLGAMLGVWK